MDNRPHTSSDQSHDGSGWSFMRLTPANDTSHDNQIVRSRPPSSYIRGSDRSSVSPLAQGHRVYDASRSSRSLSRNIPSASTGARSTTTLPSQPVLSRINSEYAYDHNNQFVRRNRRPITRDPITGMPALKEFSMAGILAAVEEDIEGHVNTIAEILGRNRFVLADEYGAQLPPQGEILGEDIIVEEIDAQHEIDNVFIANEDGSLIEGSNSGSAAYGLLERLQVLPQPVRVSSDAPLTTRTVPEEPNSLIRATSSPASVRADTTRPRTATVEDRVRTITFSQPLSLRLRRRGPARPVVSETWLSAEADGVNSGMVPTVVESGRHYPLYTHEEIDLFESSGGDANTRVARAGADAWRVSTLPIFASWFAPARTPESRDAETRLRGLLNR